MTRQPILVSVVAADSASNQDELRLADSAAAGPAVRARLPAIHDSEACTELGTLLYLGLEPVFIGFSQQSSVVVRHIERQARCSSIEEAMVFNDYR